MTEQEYEAALAELGWSRRQAANHLGYCLRTSQRYANGRSISKPASKLLNLVLVARFKGSLTFDEIIRELS